MADLRQSCFAAGELSPSFYARTDSDRYAKGVRLARDTFMSKAGDLVSRPGTRMLGRSSAAMVNVGGEIVVENVLQGRRPRLIAFSGSPTGGGNYVLEFVEVAIRVWKNGQLIVGGVGEPDSIATPYHSGDFGKIQVVQRRDVLFIACDGYAPATLTRNSDTSWTYAAIDFSKPQPTDSASAVIDPFLTSISYYAPDTAHPALPRSWVVTQLRKDADGNGFETRGQRVAKIRAHNGDLWLSDYAYPAGIIISKVIGSTLRFFNSLLPNNLNQPPSGVGPTAYWLATDAGTFIDVGGYLIAGSWSAWSSANSYRGGFGGLPGAIVQANSGAFYFSKVDQAAPSPDPDADGGVHWQQYSPAKIEIDLAVDANVVVYVDKPATIGLCEPAAIPSGSTFVGWSVYRGVAGVYGWVGDVDGRSGAGTFIDYGIEPDLSRNPPEGTNPFVIKDAQGNVLRTEMPVSVGFFEDRCVWGGTRERPDTVIASATGDYFNFDVPFEPTASSPLDFNLSSGRRETIRSIIGKDKLFIFTNGSVWSAGGANGPIEDDSIEAHVQVSVGASRVQPIIVGNSVLWVRDQGTGVRAVEFDLQRGTYLGQDLSFFANHLMLGHQLVDICHAENPWGTTWAVREDGLLLALTYTPDDQLWGWSRHQLLKNEDGTPQQVISVCSIPENGQDAVYLALADPLGGPAWIVRFSSRLELDDEATATLAGTGGGLEYGLGGGIGQGVAGTPAASGIVRPGDPICLDAWINAQNHPSDDSGIFAFSGLTDYAMRTVWVLIDGVIYGPATVNADGTLNIDTGTGAPQPGSNIYLGFGFFPSTELLGPAGMRWEQKIVNRVALEVKASGKFEVGASFDKMREHDMPDPADDDLVKVQIKGRWSTGGRVCVRQVLPLPLTIRAVLRKVEAGAS